MCTFNLTLSEDLTNQVQPNSKVKSIDQLSPEIQALLAATALLAGSVPEWDLNGDVAHAALF